MVESRTSEPTKAGYFWRILCKNDADLLRYKYLDDHGIDFVVETKNGFLKFQVKTVRDTTGYVFMRKNVFDISDKSLYLLLIRLEHPEIYAIPISAWNDSTKTAFVSRDYDRKKSKPEYGFNISKKNLHQLDCHKIENSIDLF